MRRFAMLVTFLLVAALLGFAHTGDAVERRFIRARARITGR